MTVIDPDTQAGWVAEAADEEDAEDMPLSLRLSIADTLTLGNATCGFMAVYFTTTGILIPHLDTDVINVFLGAFSRRLAPDVHAVLIRDGAGSHTGGDLVVPSNVSLIRLPPYSPELNPVENLWHYLRAHHWSNRVYADYEALLEAATEAWRQVCLDPEKIRSICAAPYLAERR